MGCVGSSERLTREERQPARDVVNQSASAHARGERRRAIELNGLHDPADEEAGVRIAREDADGHDAIANGEHNV